MYEMLVFHKKVYPSSHLGYTCHLRYLTEYIVACQINPILFNQLVDIFLPTH